MKKSIYVLLLTASLYSNAQVPATTNMLDDTAKYTSIGSTTSASYKLSVNGAAKLYGSGFNTLKSPSLFLENSTAVAGKNYAINSFDNGSLIFWDITEGNFPRLVINTNGNVGIGMNSPTSLLSLGSKIGKTKLAIYEGSPLLKAGFGWITGQFRVSLSSAKDRFSFLATENSTNELLTILGNGNVGIGNSNPGSPLTVNSTVAGNSGVQLQQMKSSSLKVSATNGRKLSVDTAGNIILVADSVNIGYGMNGIVTPNNGGTGLTNLGTANQQLRVNAVGAALEFFTNTWNNTGADVLSTNTGFIGIGISASPDPSNTQLKLAVGGDIYAKKLKVTQQGWADFVFASNYHLPSLEAVAHYINQHGHLPGVLTATEVAEKGLDIGNSQAMLLQKIEELTLYIIEQDKKIKAVEEKISLQQKSN